MKVTVKVPATTANIGPGFDCFGIALSIYNKITLEELIYPAEGLEINVFSGENENDSSLLTIPTDRTNIVYKAVELLYNYVGQTPPGLKINIEANIPIAKGLGSSASVIVGGILAANKLLGNPADEAALLSIANEVEGHPDNITPAILGGFNFSSAEEDGSIVYRKIDWPENWKFIVCIPDYELSTQISRSVLPEKVDMKDAIFNLKRSAMFIEALHKENAELMKYALNDKLHQVHRSRLVTGFDKAKERLDNLPHILGTVISGAGPAVLVIYEKNNNFEDIKSELSAVWRESGVKVAIKNINIDTKGAVII
ncbi:MAG TPA: homoserine kinase [Candidatus Gastranaerophilales bacterium]|nr:homoserine kinase [Candidatus Gastranaerophilales bacterium]